MMKLTRFKLALLLYVAFDFLIGGHCGGLLPLGEVMAAQSGPPAIGNITSAGSTCSTTSVPTNCVILQLDAASGAATIDISGTWAATLQFEGFTGVTWTNINCTPPNSTTAASSSTANGAWQCNVAAYSAIMVRGSAYTSGTAVVYINSAHASAKSGGGSVFASGGTTANLIPKENGSGALVDSLLSDSGTALTYNAKAVPSFTTGGATTNTIPKTSGTGGLLADSSITDNGAGAVTIPGAIANQGTLTVSQLATPANATLVVTGGVGTNYTYKLVAKVGSVGTAVNSGVSTAAGPTTLDGTHFIDINFTSQNGCTSIDVYRTVGGATQGKIGNVACTTVGSALTLRDNALVGDASTAPVVDNEVVTSAEPIVVPAGAIAAPSIQWAETTANAGWYRNGANVYEFSLGNSTVPVRFQASTSGAVVVNTMLGFSTNPNATVADLFVRRRGAGNFTFGGADINGTPVDQSTSVQNAITGSDLPGGHFTIDAPLGTGLGAASKISINRAIMKATGATGQTAQNAFAIGQSKTLSNTSATAQTIATITLGSNAGGGASGIFTLVCTDGTNFDSETQSFNVSFVNKATVVTVGTPAITTSTAANNSGSCTLGITAVASGNDIALKVTPVFGTIVPTTVTLYPIITHSTNTVTFN